MAAGWPGTDGSEAFPEDPTAFPGCLDGEVMSRADSGGGVSRPETRDRSGPRPGRIRPVAATELPKLADLDQRIFGALAYPFFVLRQIYDVHADDLLVLEEGGRLRGYCLGVAGSPPELGWILGLGVEPAARGLGYGERLARASFARLARSGVSRVRLTVTPYNDAAAALYRKLGFRLIAQVADYLGPGEHRRLLEAPMTRPTGPTDHEHG
jgi:ribosomal protein S18 acetylase RimI-like enzyme